MKTMFILEWKVIRTRNRYAPFYSVWHSSSHAVRRQTERYLSSSTRLARFKIVRTSPDLVRIIQTNWREINVGIPPLVTWPASSPGTYRGYSNRENLHIPLLVRNKARRDKYVAI